MKILRRYILKDALRNLVLCSFSLTAMFSIFDTLDRIDVMLKNDPKLIQIFLYIIYKIPIFIHQTFPISMILATVLTIGLLCKNSELTAMRAAGLKVMWLCKPIVYLAIFVTVLSLFFSEIIVPIAIKKSKEIYNIDIQKKHKSGAYSQEKIWWRDKNNFYSANMFNSRNNSLVDFLNLNLNSNFQIISKINASKVKYLEPTTSWLMQNVTQSNLVPTNSNFTFQKLDSLPLPSNKTPNDFYKANIEPSTMTYLELKDFIKEQNLNGLSTSSYTPDLYFKFAFPFIILISTFAIIPLSLKPARTGTMATSFIAGIIICFLYYFISSISLAFGRAEFWHPFFAAWMANIILAAVAFVLQLSVEEG